MNSSYMAEACWLPAAAPELPTAMQASPMAPHPCSVFVQQTCRRDSVLPTKRWLVEQSLCNCQQSNWTVVWTAQVND